MIEVGNVVLIAIGEGVAEQAHAAVGVTEDEAAKVAGERLRAGADRHEVVIRSEIGEFAFYEPLLQRHESAAARRPLRDIGADDAKLVDGEVIDVERGGDFDTPVDRPKRRIAMKQIKRQEKILRVKELIRTAEELARIRIGRA